MNAEYIIGLIAGIAAGLIIFAVAVRCCRDNGQYRSKYDERQKIAMGKAYREGFWTLLIAGVIATQLTRIDALQEYTVMIFSMRRLHRAGSICSGMHNEGCLYGAERQTEEMADSSVCHCGIQLGDSAVQHAFGCRSGCRMGQVCVAGAFVVIATRSALCHKGSR